MRRVAGAPVLLTLCAALAGADEAGKTARRPNRLAQEKSPYLLQHAHNPVDWYPWGPEAFERARKEGKPIFLSIGYSTCHWCHVMERESFVNEKIAAYLNEHFVSIKVDREERPDVDQVYMAAVLAQTGSGGWPLSAFLTPDGKPFFTGTYFPPEDDPRRGRGFLSLCQRVQEVWSSNRAEVESQADRFAQMLRAQAEGVLTGAPLQPEVLAKGFSEMAASYDDVHGGFGQDRKFPRTTVLDFLLRYALRAEAIQDGTAVKARAMVSGTLDAMLRGGLRDHLAGGFHRYSVDRQWLVPHFEKMLYDQALITRTLVDAYRASSNAAYLEVARETMDYVLARLCGPDGELYSAEDADTGGEEGKTYVWRRAEVLEILGPERGERFCAAYGVTEEGNFEEGGKGACVLHLSSPQPPGDFAEDRRRLLAARDKRPQPFRDDKVLVEWNGFAIGALAVLHQVTGEAKYLEAARRTARFVLERLTRDGKLLRRYRQGEAAIDAFLEDHAALGEGLLDLFEADFDPRWLEAAVRLSQDMLDRFRDEKTGTFFSSGQGQEALIAPTRDFYDGAVPSGNSVAFAFLLRLAALTEAAPVQQAVRTLEKAIAPLLERDPDRHPKMLCAAAFLLAPPREIVIGGDPADPLIRSMLHTLRSRFLPAMVVVLVPTSEAAERLKMLVPLVEGKGPLGGKPVAFVCRGGVCKLPARDLAALERQIAEP